MEDGGGPGSEMVALLQKSLHGTRDAAANFHRDVKKLMREQGFVVGAYNGSNFYHRQRGLRVMVYGDDFISTGSREFFHRKGEALDGRVFNRVIRACFTGWEYDGDQRYAELVVGAMDLKVSEHSHHTRCSCEEGEGGGEAVGEQGHKVQAVGRPHKLHWRWTGQTSSLPSRRYVVQ